MSESSLGKRLNRIKKRFGTHIAERILIKTQEKEERMALKEYQVTVTMTRMQEEQLEDTITVMAESESEAERQVEEMDSCQLEQKLDGADSSGWHDGWVYQCLYSQDIDSLDIECMEEEDEEVEVNG